MHWEDPERGTEWVYLTYSKDEPGNDKRSATALVRAEWRADAKALGPLEELFVALPYEGTHHHYGSRVGIGGDGKLYLTCGERGKRDVHPQTLTTSPGKVHRFNMDGSCPTTTLWDKTGRCRRFGRGDIETRRACLCPPNGPSLDPRTRSQRGRRNQRGAARKELRVPVITFGKTTRAPSSRATRPWRAWSSLCITGCPPLGRAGLRRSTEAHGPRRGREISSRIAELRIPRTPAPGGRPRGEARPVAGRRGRVRDIARNPSGDVFVAVEGAGKIFHLVPASH